MTKELLTHTKRKDFLWCPRYFFHRHEQFLQPVARRAGRWKGTVFGEALQAARDSREHGDFQEDAMIVALGVIRDHYRELEESGVINDQDDADSLEVEQVKMTCIVPAYIQHYGLAPRREVEFYLPLPVPGGVGRSRTFDLAGKLDGMEIVGKRTARVIEDKLVGAIQRPMIDRLPLDAQSSEYVDALRTKGWSAEIAYRHTRWPGINPVKERRLKTKTVPAESLPEFATRLSEDIGERQEFYFDEQVLNFPDEHLEDYRAGRWGVGRMIMDARIRARKKGWQAGWPMNPTRCWEFGGCEFIPLCTKQPDAIERYRVTDPNQELSIGKDDEE